MIHVSGVSCLKALTMIHPPPPEFSWIAVMVFPSQKKNSAIIHFSCRLRSLRPFGVQCIPSFKKWTRFHIWLFPKSFFLFDRLILGFWSNDGLNYITLSLILRVPVKKIPNVSSTLGFFNHPSSSTYPTQNHGRAGVYPSCHRVRWEVHTGQAASLL